MAARIHAYEVTIEWTGDRGAGTADYRAYGRDHLVRAAGKPAIPGSSDPAFRGDPARWNPEELLVAAVAACHQLWYLHLCADHGIAVLAYMDRAGGTMADDRMTAVALRPRVTIRAGDDAALAHALHDEAHRRCAIARSLACPVTHEAMVEEG